jgi:hypothetical protein
METQPEPPKPLKEKPDLYDDLIPVWESFWFLRSSIENVKGIPLTESIAYWKNVIGINDQVLLSEKISLIHAMDSAFVEIAKEKAETEHKKQEMAAKRGS